MNKKLLTVAVLLFACVASLAAQSPSPDVQAKSKAVVGQLAARQFDKVEALFDSTMASALPADKLAATWDSVLAQAGKFKSTGETRQEELRGYRVVFVTSKFDSTALDVKLIWDKDDHIAGLSVVPHPPKATSPSEIDGTWAGTLDVGGNTLRLVFHITNTEKGLVATMDSPDQNAKGIPVATVTRQGASVKLELKQINGGFDGKLNQDLTVMDGNWSQGGASYPLLLKRAKN